MKYSPKRLPDRIGDDWDDVKIIWGALRKLFRNKDDKNLGLKREERLEKPLAKNGYRLTPV